MWLLNQQPCNANFFSQLLTLTYKTGKKLLLIGGGASAPSTVQKYHHKNLFNEFYEIAKVAHKQIGMINDQRPMTVHLLLPVWGLLRLASIMMLDLEKSQKYMGFKGVCTKVRRGP